MMLITTLHFNSMAQLTTTPKQQSGAKAGAISLPQL